MLPLILKFTESIGGGGGKEVKTFAAIEICSVGKTLLSVIRQYS